MGAEGDKAAKAAKCLKVALVQMCVDTDKKKNLEAAAKHIQAAKCKKAKLIVLPECFNSPYGIEHFKKNAEALKGGPTACMLENEAKKNCVYLVGGSFPEDDCGKVYNTCTVWDPTGKMIAKYRKMHLFDIDIPKKIKFKESEVIKKGDKMVTCNIEGFKVGLGICYDMRFEELAKLYRIQGCNMLIYPAAFNCTTGPLHFELLQRARAVDNQSFVCSASPSRGKCGYQAWGYSQITDPWGKILAQAKEKEAVIYGTLEMKAVEEARAAIPIFCQRRTDKYDLKKK